MTDFTNDELLDDHKLDARLTTIRQCLQELLQAAEGALEFEKDDLFSPVSSVHPLVTLETAIQKARRYA